MKLKILSWNIWTDGYFDQVSNFLKSSDADFIGLQEVVADDPQRDVISFLAKLGYQHVFAPVKKIWPNRTISDGPAIFSKHKIQSSETYILSEKDARAAARADIQVGDEILYVFSTHLIHTHQRPSGLQGEQGLNLIQKLPGKHTIVMGDFNATPNSAVIKNVKKALFDSDPKSQPTWSVYPEGCPTCNPQEVDTKLDYIFTSRDLRTSGFKVEDSKASDHLPISVVVEI